MLTEEGKESARECLSRSGLASSIDGLPTKERSSKSDPRNIINIEFACINSGDKMAALDVDSSAPEKSVDVPPESLDRVCSKFLY